MSTPTVPPAPAAGPAPASPTAPSAPVSAPPLRIALTILHLAGLGLIGAFVFTTLAGLLGLGVGLVFVLGFGLLFLVAFVYAFYGAGWFEVARASSLYRLGLPPLRWRGSPRTGFGGWLHSLWRQLIDGRTWRAIANLVIASIMGAILVRLFEAMIRSAISSFAPLTGAETIGLPFRIGGTDIPVAWAPLVGILGIVLSAAAIVGLALLHRVITLAIVVPNREAELTEQVRTTSAQREGAVRAADVERTRIERDLHDGVQPRLVSVGMTLGLAQQKIDTDPDAAKELIGEAHTSTKAAITELRQLARGIHASVLDDRGLDAALSALASRSHIPVSLDVRMNGRCSRDAEAAVYFSIAESLTNAAKHSRASECRVIVRLREGGTLWARVEDNGMGGATVQPGGGLDGVSNRVLAAGGTFRLDSPQGGPTALEVSVPCAS
jgi:signal transduction histidine kinase